MKFHLDRTIRLKVEEKHKALYRWSLNEIDGDGNPVGGDQVPWPWSLYFIAFKISQSDELTVKGHDGGLEGGLSPTAGMRRTIFAKMRPSDGRTHFDWRTPKYRMFGTDSQIDEFLLMIIAGESEDTEEICNVFGSPAYTSNNDYTEEGQRAFLQFSFIVKPSTFNLYSHRLQAGHFDKLLLRVNGAEGFYSDWSPSIDTSAVKVLVPGREHAVTLPEGFREPPRLGRVGEAWLSMSLDRPLDAPPADKPAHAPTQLSLRHPTEGAGAGAARRAADTPWFDQPRWILALLVAIAFAIVFVP